jgi:hypothetical protein
VALQLYPSESSTSKNSNKTRNFTDIQPVSFPNNPHAHLSVLCFDCKKVNKPILTTKNMRETNINVSEVFLLNF